MRFDSMPLPEPPVNSKELLRLFRLLSDDTRLRLLRLLAKEELTVNELATIAQISQPRVSNHLKLLREENLVLERREGSWRHYRIDREHIEDLIPGLWPLLESAWADEDAYAADDQRMMEVLAARKPDLEQFFDQLSGQWDDIREGLFGDALGREILRAFLPRDITVADVGTGTGYVLSLFHPGVEKMIAIDHSESMLDVAREKLGARGAHNVDYRLGDAHNLPLEDGEADVLTHVQVLHFLEHPEHSVRESARGLKLGGLFILSDFLEHQEIWLEKELRHVWSGFSRGKLNEWLTNAGMELRHFAVLPGRAWSAQGGHRLNVPDGFILVAAKTGRTPKFNFSI